MDWRANLRQWRYPKEFRISAPPWPAGIREQLQEVAQLLKKQSGSARPDQRFLADLGTGLWRLRLKMVQPETGRPLEEMRRAFRHFESVWDALGAVGMKVYDHTGEAYDRGQLLQVRAFPPTPGLKRETIIETIKPTIYLKDEMIQAGEVIVGIPEETAQGK